MGSAKIDGSLKCQDEFHVKPVKVTDREVGQAAEVDFEEISCEQQRSQGR